VVLLLDYLAIQVLEEVDSTQITNARMFFKVQSTLLSKDVLED
jgi:hypothetical protein